MSLGGRLKLKIAGTLLAFTSLGAVCLCTLNDARKSLSAARSQISSQAYPLLDQSSAALQRAGHLTLLCCAGGIVLTLGLGISQYLRVVRPLRQLSEGARRVASGHLRPPVEVGGSPEFGELSAGLNHLARELASLSRDLEDKVMAKSRELVRSERLASVGYLAAGVAHEINNPLNIITGHAELSLRRVETRGDSASAEIKEALRIIREEGFRCKRITEKLISLSRTACDSRETVEISRIADEVVELVRGLAQFRDRRLRLEAEPTGPMPVWGNECELKQVLLNLVVNALQAVSPGTGEVVVETRRRGGTVELVVRDNGCGMRADTLERVFEPFFSMSPPGGVRSTGLGLSITHAIVEAHGGRIMAESAGADQGSCFTIQLPAFSANGSSAA